MSKRPSICPGCKLANDKHYFGLPSKTCEGRQQTDTPSLLDPSTPKKDTKDVVIPSGSTKRKPLNIEGDLAAISAELASLEMEEAILEKEQHLAALKEKLRQKRGKVEALKTKPSTKTATRVPASMVPTDLPQLPTGLTSNMNTPLDHLLANLTEDGNQSWLTESTNGQHAVPSAKQKSAQMFLTPSQPTKDVSFLKNVDMPSLGNSYSSQSSKQFERKTINRSKINLHQPVKERCEAVDDDDYDFIPSTPPSKKFKSMFFGAHPASQSQVVSKGRVLAADTDDEDSD